MIPALVPHAGVVRTAIVVYEEEVEVMGPELSEAVARSWGL